MEMKGGITVTLKSLFAGIVKMRDQIGFNPATTAVGCVLFVFTVAATILFFGFMYVIGDTNDRFIVMMVMGHNVPEKH